MSHQAWLPGATISSTRGRVRTASRFGATAGVSVRKRRRWYGADADADDTDDADQPGAEDAEDVDTDDETDDSDSGEWSIDDLPAGAQEYIRSLRSEAAENRRKAKTLEQKQAERERKAKEEQGKYKELYEEVLPKLERLEALEQREEERRERLAQKNAERIKGVKNKDAREKIQAAVDKLGSPEDVAEALDNLIPLIGQKPAPNLGGGNKGDSGSSVGEVTISKASY